MPKTLADVKTVLEGLDNKEEGKELYEAVENEVATKVNAERETGRGLVKVEVEKVKTNAEALGKMGYDSAKGSLNDFVTSTTGKLEKAGEDFKKLTANEQTMATMTGRMESMEKKQVATDKKAIDSDEKLRKSKLKNGILPKLTKTMYGADLRVDDVIRKGLVVLADDGETVQYKSRSGSIVAFDEGIKEYYEDNKDSLINTQNPGPGSGPSDNIDSSKVKTMAEYNTMSPQARQEHTKGGGTFKD